jgi:two-component system, OmpR family, response regulator MtrA
MKKRLLMVEDDEALGRVLCDNLVFAGFDVEWVTVGDAALRSVRAAAPDMVLLDVMLPGRDGFELCGLLRENGRTPIIMLTALGQKADKIRGLELGADDYVTKPFHVDELIARIQAVLRRSRPSVHCLTLGAIAIDFVNMAARDHGREFHLTHREFEVLRYLAERAGMVVKRDELLREIWGYLEMPNTRSVDHAINRLRKKVEPDPHAPSFIQTVHGDGYCLIVPQ